MLRRQKSQRWPWEYGIGRGPGGDLQFERHRVPPLSVQNQALQADLMLSNHYLVQEKERTALLQRRVQEVEYFWRVCDQQRQNLEHRRQDLEHQISELNIDYDRLDERNQRANDKIRDLKREKKRLKNKIDFLIHYEAVDHRRIRALERDLRQLDTVLQQRTQEADDLRQQLTRTERDLGTMRTANNDLRINIAEKKAEITRLRGELEDYYWNGPNRI